MNTTVGFETEDPEAFAGMLHDIVKFAETHFDHFWEWMEKEYGTVRPEYKDTSLKAIKDVHKAIHTMMIKMLPPEDLEKFINEVSIGVFGESYKEFLENVANPGRDESTDPSVGDPESAE
jgi:hypothetical protein